MVVGYFGLFDMGMGRALTKLVAEKLGTGQKEEIPAMVWTGFLLMLLLGVAGSLIAYLLSTSLVYNILKIPEALRIETLHSFHLLAFSIPFVTGSTCLRAVLEAKQRFDLINTVRIPMGIFTFSGPLVVLPFSQSLVSIVGILLIARILSMLVLLLLCIRVIPELSHDIRPQRAAMKPLLLFSCWLTVSNIIGPLMLYLDRFLIGGMISVAAVSYYTTPYEVVIKLWVLPFALVGVLFPNFSAGFIQDPKGTALLFNRGTKYLFLALFPIILLFVTLAYEGLDLWLGSEFALNSTRVLQWLAVGVFINSLAQIPYALVQGAGRPDITAKLHMIELPCYLITAWWLIKVFGIEGAAIAWVMRMSVDKLLLFIIAGRMLKIDRSTSLRMGYTFGVALLALSLAIFPNSFFMKGSFLLLTLSVFALASWFLILAPEERCLVLNRFKTAQPAN